MIASTSSQAKFAVLRQMLTRRLQELDAEIRANEERSEEGKDPNDVTDRKDEASFRQAGEVDDVQLQRATRQRVQVEAALRRMDHGTYGDCVECGEPIAMQRLLVQPAAKRCATCQAASEQAAA